MQDEIWSWQNGTASSETLTAVAAGDDGTVLLAGYTEGSWGRQIAAEGDTEMVATKLQLTDSGATELWRWQGGWDTRVDGVAKAKITSAAMAPDGSVFLVGGGQEESSFDSVVFRLDSSGSLVWEWKGDGVMYDALHLTGMALVGDASGDVYVVGSTLVGDGSGDIYAGGSASYAEESDGWFFVAYRVSAEGSDVWRWQGTNSTSWQLAGAASIDDGNAVVFVGEAITIALNHNTYSYPYAVKLDSNGNELWVWEDDPSYSSLPRCTDVAAANNESVVLACAFDGDRGRFGDSDFGAVMLNSSDGDEMWRWQGGTVEDDEAFGVAVTESGDIVLAGYTEGSWTMESLGGKDFAAVRLSSSDWAASVVSGWQGGSAVDAADSGDDEECTAIAMSVNDTVILAGGTGGSWSTTNAGGTDFAAVGVLASFSGTPDVASPTSPPAEEYEPAIERIARLFFELFIGYSGAAVLFVALVLCCCLHGCCTKHCRRRGGNVSRQQDQRATELSTAGPDGPAEFVAYCDAAAPVTSPIGGLQHERSSGKGGGLLLAAEGGVVPHSHAVEAPPTSDTDGSGRAWTVVAAEVVK